MTKIYSLLTFVAFLMLQLIGLTQGVTLKTNIESSIYKKGQPIVVTAFLDTPGADSLHIQVLHNNNHVVLKKAFVSSNQPIVVFEGAYKEACSLIIEAQCGDQKSSIGCVVDPLKLKPGFKQPKDFDQFWNTQKSQLAKLPFEVKKVAVDVPNGDSDYECYDMELNCTSPKPARGYLAKPKNAAAKSLPIVIFFRAAGVKGSWCKSSINEALGLAKRGNGALCFDLNAHGMMVGQPDAYYEELEAGELKNYWLQGIESRDTYYFLGMYLRLLRTIEYMTQQPEWDGKRILVIGESQGGGQSLVAAGLDSRVTAVVATVPAMCDFGGVLINRKSGWPQPIESTRKTDDVRNTLPYFDAAMMLKKSKATLVVEIGFIDQTCPATSVYAAVNQSKGKKIIYGVPYRTHGWPEKPHREDWDKTVYSAKNAFVDKYLK